MKRQAPLRQRRWNEPVLRRVERVAHDLNPILLVIVVGLLILNLSCYTALRLAHLHPLGAGTSQLAPGFESSRFS